LLAQTKTQTPSSIDPHSALVCAFFQNYFLPVFTPVKRGRRAKAVIREFTNKDGTKKLEVSMFEQLDAADQDLFLAILTLCSNGTPLNASGILNAKGHILKMDSIKVETTAYDLLKQAGKKPGKNTYEWLAKSLDRLSKTSLKFSGNKAVWSVNLLSYSFEKDENGIGKVSVFVNPIAAMVFTYGCNYIKHDLRQRFTLAKDTTKVLHGYLVGKVREGEQKEFCIDTLAQKVFSEEISSLPKKSRTKKRSAIRAALQEINSLEGWSVKLSKTKAVVKRKKAA